MIYQREGAEMYVDVRGEGAPLLLLHGWGGTHESWLPVLRDFADRRRLYSVDFPGHGQSKEPPAPWSVTEYTDLLAHFMQDEGLSRADIVAHSFGGRVAILLAATHPELVGRLVLTGCAGIPPKRTNAQKARGALYRGLRTLADNPLTRGALGDARVDQMRDKLQSRFGSADYKALTPSMRQTFSRVVRQDLTPYLSKIRASTLLFWGDQDTATPIWMARVMEREIPDAGLVVMPGATHFAYLERYDSFRPVLEAFLKLDGGAPADGERDHGLA